MIAGELNELISIERLEIIKNGYGEVEATEWINKINTRADISYKSGARVDDNNELFFSYNVIFGVRYYHQINELDRVVWNGKYYRIMAIQPEKKIQRKLLHCELINE